MPIKNAGEAERLRNKQATVWEYIKLRGVAGPLAFKVWRGPLLALMRQGRLRAEQDGKPLSYQEVTALPYAGPGFRFVVVESA